MFNLKVIATTVLSFSLFSFATPVAKDGVQLPTTIQPEHAALAKVALRAMPEKAWEDCLPYTIAEDKSKQTCKDRAAEVLEGGELLAHEAALYHYMQKGGGIILNVPEKVKSELKEVCEHPRFVARRKEGKFQASSYRDYNDDAKSANVSQETIRTFGSFQCLDKGDYYMITDTYKVDRQKYDDKETVLDLGEGGQVVALAFRHFIGRESSKFNFTFKVKVNK